MGEFRVHFLALVDYVDACKSYGVDSYIQLGRPYRILHNRKYPLHIHYWLCEWLMDALAICP